MTHIGGASARTLRIRSDAIPLHLGEPALEPVRLSGREGLNRLFEYELLLKTPDALNLGASGATDFDLDAFIGREINCLIELDGAGEFLPGAAGASVDRIGAGTREINALITEAALWGEEGRHVQYRLVLRPWLHLASLSTDCRIFQNKTVVEILDELLGDYPFPVDKRLVETYPARDYQTQYNESDLTFFERLTQEWGINWFFEHSDGKHRLVLIDNLGGHKANPSAAYQQVEYHAPGWKLDAEYLHAFVPHHQLTSGRYSTRDYDYTRPRADLSTGRKDPRPTGQNNGEVYQWHADRAGSHYAQPRAGTAEANDPQAEGDHLARLRMQQLRTHGARAKASGNLWAYVRVFMEEGMDAVPAPEEEEWRRKGRSSMWQHLWESQLDPVLRAAKLKGNPDPRSAVDLADYLMELPFLPLNTLAQWLCYWPTFPEEWNSDCGQQRREDGIGPKEPLRWAAKV